MTTKYSALELCTDSGLGLDSGHITSKTSLSSYSCEEEYDQVKSALPSTSPSLPCTLEDGNRVPTSDNSQAFQVDDDGDT